MKYPANVYVPSGVQQQRHQQQQQQQQHQQQHHHQQSTGQRHCRCCRCCRREQQQQAPMLDPASKLYFYGRLTREQAEEHLVSRGCQEGLFLLRASADANYAVSICHDGKVLHYSVERQADGSFQIPNGRRFVGPVELINHHAGHLDGFLTLAKIACNRAPGSSPFVLQGITQAEVAEALVAKATELGYKGYQLEHVLTGAERRRIRQLVLRDFHQRMAWYHSEICREEADRRLALAGQEEGAFLVRRRRADDSFALSLSFQREPKHYRICRRTDKRLFIDGGKAFDSLVELVDHYYMRQEGLLCKLRKPVPFPGYCQPSCSCGSACSGSSSNGSGCRACDAAPDAEAAPAQPELDLISFGDWTLQGAKHPPQSVCRQASSEEPQHSQTLPAQSLRTSHILDQPWEEPADTSGDWLADTLPNCPASDQLILIDDSDDSGTQQKMYDDIPHSEVTFELAADQLRLGARLGCGNFGEVLRAVYGDRAGREVPVAVKTLKEDSLFSGEPDILAEARNMASLRHRHIVRLIGVCRGHTVMLVLELAPLGPINKYLKKHPDCSKELLTELLYQVAQGMQYLETQKFVHRDLAARNVLLASRCHAKISDFGMSKTLGHNNDYYRAEQAGRWPLKWYSPESIYFFKFSSKSDVWSYGVTCWEVFSYGDRPYRDKKGTEIIEMLERGERLARPQACPRWFYSLLLQCWDYSCDARPSFAAIVQRLSVMPRAKA